MKIYLIVRDSFSGHSNIKAFLNESRAKEEVRLLNDLYGKELGVTSKFNAEHGLEPPMSSVYYNINELELEAIL